MKIPNSDFLIVTAMLSAFGGLGIWEGYAVNPIFYSQSAVLFGGVGYFAYRIFWLERTEHVISPSSNAA
ncbi:MAG: hypothetical protein ACREA4_00275 [Nitrososphaera sp.]